MFSHFKSQGEGGKGKPYPWLLILVGVAGVLLFLFGGNLIPEEKSEENITQETSPQAEILSYQSYLEDRVEGLCRQVAGVGNVQAVVTLEGGFTAQYAQESADGKTTYVLVGSGSGQGGLYLSGGAPTIAGIGVVCEGGGSPGVQEELTHLLAAAFGVPTNRIHITKLG